MADLGSLTTSDRQLVDYVRQQRMLHPKQLALALKVQRQNQGPLDMVLWQLGFIELQQLNQFWEFRNQRVEAS
ncbi:MAG: DUF2949 domain-containing protein [Cyanobacteriota bacterium]|nr:DUF2949 domain-containing protein [Cyanobacteriota bacterium]